jgi:hypothetical protein
MHSFYRHFFLMIVSAAMVTSSMASETLLDQKSDLLVSGLNYWAGRSPPPYNEWNSNAVRFVAQQMYAKSIAHTSVVIDVDRDPISALWGEYHANASGTAWPEVELSSYQQINVLSGMLMQHADPENACILAQMILSHYSRLSPYAVAARLGPDLEEDKARLLDFWRVTLPTAAGLMYECNPNDTIRFIRDELLLNNASSAWYVSPNIALIMNEVYAWYDDSGALTGDTSSNQVSFAENLVWLSRGRMMPAILFERFLNRASEDTLHQLAHSLVVAAGDVMRGYTLDCRDNKAELHGYLGDVITRARDLVSRASVDESSSTPAIPSNGKIFANQSGLAIEPAYIFSHYIQVLELIEHRTPLQCSSELKTELVSLFDDISLQLSECDKLILLNEREH